MEVLLGGTFFPSLVGLGVRRLLWYDEWQPRVALEVLDETERRNRDREYR